MVQKKIVVIDSNAIIHRAYHAYPDTLTTIKGQQVNAVYGFTSMFLEVIDQLGYIQRTSARKLKSGNLNNVGVILPTITDNYYARVYTGLQNMMINRGFNVSLAITNDIVAVEEKALFNMLSEGVAGIALVPSNPGYISRNVRILKDRNIPLVLIDRKINVDYGNFISFDYFV